MKYSRLLIGFIAIALALWIIIGELSKIND